MPRASPASADLAILDWARPDFDTAYLILHPFIGAPGRAMEMFGLEDYPSRERINALCTPVKWAHVAQKFGFANLAQLDRILLSCIGAIGGSQSYSRPVATSFLESLEAHGLVAPGEGCFSDLLVAPMLKSIQDATANGVVMISDEFGLEEREAHISDLLSVANDSVVDRLNLYSPDGSILYTVHWDSFYTLLLGTSRIVKHVVESHGFEGFYATPTTRIRWSS